MWSMSEARASVPHQGKTQCLSRWMTCSRIASGTSWPSTAHCRFRSSTGVIDRVGAGQPGPDALLQHRAELLHLPAHQVVIHAQGERLDE